MIYRLPEISDQEILQAYVQEHFDHGENSISASVGVLALEYPDWVRKIQTNASIGDAQWGRSLVYLCFDQGRLMGLLSIRYELPEELSRTIGDIGYGVRPSERNKGYATAMLRHALSVCKENGMSEAILGCYKDNPASVAVIQKNGGVLIAENDNYSQGRTSQYYSIALSSPAGGREGTDSADAAPVFRGGGVIDVTNYAAKSPADSLGYMRGCDVSLFRNGQIDICSDDHAKVLLERFSAFDVVRAGNNINNHDPQHEREVFLMMESRGMRIHFLTLEKKNEFWNVFTSINDRFFVL